MPHEHWAVTVETQGEQIVSIEPRMLCGREISDDDRDAIRTAAYHRMGVAPMKEHLLRALQVRLGRRTQNTQA